MELALLAANDVVDRLEPPSVVDVQRGAVWRGHHARINRHSSVTRMQDAVRTGHVLDVEYHGDDFAPLFQDIECDMGSTETSISAKMSPKMAR